MLVLSRRIKTSSVIASHVPVEQAKIRAAISNSSKSTKTSSLQSFFASPHSKILEHTGLAESHLIFSTHLLPLARGILSTHLRDPLSPAVPEAIEALYRKIYAGRPWVEFGLRALCPSCSTSPTPISATSASSWINQVSASLSSLVSTSWQGAAGQAVQNFTISRHRGEEPHFNENRNQFAGALLEDDATMRSLARQVAALANEGHEILVVHGGVAPSPRGPQAHGHREQFCLRPSRHRPRDSRRSRHGFRRLVEQNASPPPFPPEGLSPPIRPSPPPTPSAFSLSLCRTASGR